MNRRPVCYMQTDPRWKDKPYQTKGETATIGGSGCGPTCAAMLIETLTGKTFTPEDACNWSMEYGYKAKGQGTYYSYFEPQFKAFGLCCRQLNRTNLYGDAYADYHDVAWDVLKHGWYLIACMGKGTWTSSGHFVVVWWQDGKVHIHDPASTKKARTEGDLSTFEREVKYYWAVDAREHNNEEDDDMDIEKLSEEQLVRLAERMQEALGKQEPADWSEKGRSWAEEHGIVKGDLDGNKQYKAFVTREQMAVMLERIHD